MHKLKTKLCELFCRVPLLFGVFVMCCLVVNPANAESTFTESFNLAPFVPLVLETMMNVATSLYKYFVGNGTGLIYITIFALLGLYIAIYVFKMYIPEHWLQFIGFSGGGDNVWKKTVSGWSVVENTLKPCLRAVIAAVVFLQIKPTYVTEWVINPFLEFGAIYTNGILQNISSLSTVDISVPACESISKQGWLSERSCNFLTQPVYKISQENNKIIAYGFNFLSRGLRGAIVLIPHGGQDILNIITGVLLISAFTSANLFMALLIIEAIFDFCLALIMYPFKVLVWVIKKSDKWLDVMPVFSQILDALKKLIITMIACAFILCVNIAIVHALFNWSSSIFVAAADGISKSNIPSVTNSASQFGQNSLLWISSILTFVLMYKIFEKTRERLTTYSGLSKHALYDDVMSSGKRMWEKTKAAPDTMKTIFKAGEKIIKKDK